MTMPGKTATITRIVACTVFKPAFDNLELGARYPDLRVTLLPSYLHLRPQELKSHLKKAIVAAKRSDERIVCIYGQCFPEIDGFCRQRHVCKIPGHYCYEMLLGRERFRQLIEAVPRTYFAEKDFLLNFEEYCVKPLELEDQEMKEYCFGHYQRLLYIRQPSDPDLRERADEVAKFLGLSLEVGDADYSYLERMLTELV